MDVSSSTSSPMKRGSFSVEHMFGSRPESMASPGLGAKDRFAEKDSLYLDMGKPELNGKIDTLANGSANNSLLLHRADSNMNVSRDGSVSGFAKQQPDQKSRSKSFRHGGNNQSILKAAIFRNMQKNNDMPGEESKEDISGSKRRDSDPITYHSKESPSNRRDSHSSDSDDDSSSDICHENPQVQLNVEKMKAGTPDMKPSKNAHSPSKKMALPTKTPGKK